jgi:hypothetical protein
MCLRKTHYWVCLNFEKISLVNVSGQDQNLAHLVDARVVLGKGPCARERSVRVAATPWAASQARTLQVLVPFGAALAIVLKNFGFRRG